MPERRTSIARFDHSGSRARGSGSPLVARSGFSRRLRAQRRFGIRRSPAERDSELRNLRVLRFLRSGSRGSYRFERRQECSPEHVVLGPASSHLAPLLFFGPAEFGAGASSPECKQLWATRPRRGPVLRHCRQAAGPTGIARGEKPKARRVPSPAWASETAPGLGRQDRFRGPASMHLQAPHIRPRFEPSTKFCVPWRTDYQDVVSPAPGDRGRKAGKQAATGRRDRLSWGRT